MSSSPKSTGAAISSKGLRTSSQPSLSPLCRCNNGLLKCGSFATSAHFSSHLLNAPLLPKLHVQVVLQYKIRHFSCEYLIHTSGTKVGRCIRLRFGPMLHFWGAGESSRQVNWLYDFHKVRPSAIVSKACHCLRSLLSAVAARGHQQSSENAHHSWRSVIHPPGPGQKANSAGMLECDWPSKVDTWSVLNSCIFQWTPPLEVTKIGNDTALISI